MGRQNEICGGAGTGSGTVGAKLFYMIKNKADHDYK